MAARVANGSVMTEKILNFTVRFPISVNHVYRAWQNRIILCPKAKEYRAAVARDIRNLKLPGFGTSRLEAHYVIHAPDHGRRDLANLDKLLTDTLVSAGVFDDDSQIDEHRFTRGAVDPGRPRVEVFLKPIE